jgi:hypothetical protein
MQSSDNPQQPSNLVQSSVDNSQVVPGSNGKLHPLALGLGMTHIFVTVKVRAYRYPALQ